MTTDPRFDERLSAYIDAELDDHERADVESLLAASPAHRDLVEQLRSTKSAVAGLAEVDPPHPLTIPAAAPSPSVPHRRWSTRRVAGAVVAIAAAWLLVLTFGAGVDRLPVVPDVDQLAVRHAQADEAEGFVPMPVDTASMPDSIGHGMDREGVYQRGSLVQVRYSDGAHAISVFHEPGDLAWDDLPGTGEMMMMDDQPAWHGVVDRVDVFVLERGDQVVTVVADAGMADMAAEVSTMMPPSDEGGSLMDRARRGARNILDLVGIQG